MRSRRGRTGSKGAARFGAVVAGVSIAALLGGVPAAADEAQGRIDNNNGTQGHRVNLGHGYAGMKTVLFKLDLDGGNSLRSYCVEIDVPIDPKRSMQERPWDEFPNPDSPFHENRNEINWVLHHGYPASDLDALAGVLTEQGAELHDGLDQKEAIAATQAAVWHYSDGKNLDRDNPVKGDDADADADVLALYDYLTGEANVGIGEQPAPALELTPEEIAGNAGERLGPFTVSTTGDITGLSSELPEGVTLTDSEGNELDGGDIADGTEIYVDVPADAQDGEGSFELQASAHLDTGRLFVSENYDRKPAQSLIVAASQRTKLTAGAGVQWQAAPQPTSPPETTTPEAPSTTSQVAAPPTTEAPVSPQASEDFLAQTGFSALTPILIGVGLVGAGVAALLLQRRRKNA
ncbi:TQXA domain-containing protein/LPXTG-motif cell wall-anchored protein [Saccharomonospora amisosensis]|uniref:TQXA domain-containing protein/LPXTG-motif cell wall-anchored protein n=1 Tax=Saccharomonospora amisosensis TaxID=1128677 RepID=A0A7X5ZTL2_9PSEU|nr:Cys-Gln thioester bond-forming surface protein [Saccharomonospora amisosensis]NIJ14440.1 TQXA domain-containing protein/LPXTG-motif cell wall-anchored protein [Saccharomonospora amisosensis]